MFKTTADIYKALLEGKKIASMDIYLDSSYVYLKNGDLVNDKDHHVTWGFSSPESWQEYIEPKWYDNIPEQGILCWVWNTKTERTIRILKYYYAETQYPYMVDGGYGWEYATPLTREEAEELIYRG